MATSIVTYDGGITTVEDSGLFIYGAELALFTVGDSVTITFNGVTYTAVAQDGSEIFGDGFAYIGEFTEDGSAPDFTTYPFIIVSQLSNYKQTCQVYTESAGTFTLKVEITAPIYLYNETLLTDINKAWTDKETYPYAYIARIPPTGVYYAMLSSQPSQYHKRSSTTDGDYFQHGTLYVQVFATGNGLWWNDGSLLSGTVNAVTSDNFKSLNYWEDFQILWANYDVYRYLDETGTIPENDGSLYLAASEPVPVEEIASAFDQQSFLMGLACGLLGKGLPESEWPISWNTAEVTNNPVKVDCTSILGKLASFVKISDYIPATEQLTGHYLVGVDSPNNLTVNLTSVQTTEFDLGTVIAYGYGDISLGIVCYVGYIHTAGTSIQIGITFPETGLYVTDFPDSSIDFEFTAEV